MRAYHISARGQESEKLLVNIIPFIALQLMSLEHFLRDQPYLNTRLCASVLSMG